MSPQDIERIRNRVIELYAEEVKCPPSDSTLIERAFDHFEFMADLIIKELELI